MKPLVYIAAPYGSSPVHNTVWAVRAGLALWRTGQVAVLIPHLTLLADLVAPMLHDEWLAYDRDMLLHCDAVLRMPGASDGADRETAYAAEHHIPTFVTKDDLLEWAEGR